MTKTGSWSKPLLLAFVALIVIAGAYLAGFVTSDQQLFPSAQILLVKSRARGWLGSAPPAQAVTELNTALIRVAVTTTNVPGDSDTRGGGITLFGKGLLGLTGSGEFFRVDGSQVTPLAIRPPPNHLAEYQAASKTGELATLRHNFELMRYNTPLYVNSGDRHLLFITYTEWQPDQHCYALALARLELPGAALEGFHASPGDWQIILRTTPCLPPLTTHEAVQAHMGGGGMAWDASAGRLLLATGEYRFNGVYAPQMLSQDDSSNNGRLLSLDLDGGSVTELARGLRNPQGLLLLPDGEIWSTEHGPRGGDELNRITRGGNYGWPYRTLGTRYSALPWPLSPVNGRHDTDAQFIGPVYAWVPSVGIGGLARVEGFDPAWDGDLLVGSMRAQTLYRLRVTEGRVQFAEPIVMQDRIRQVLQMPDGVIALWTDSRSVQYLRPAAASRTLLRARDEIALIGGGAESPRAKRLDAALQGCMECHSLDPDAAANIPHLNGVFGREVASTAYPAYSQGMRNAGGRWTRDRLASFLTDPQQFAPGTTMPSPRLEPETVGDLVALMERLNSPE